MRTLAVAFLLISGVGALVEERGIGKGILNNPDMRPQLETKTKFADVKGVDEAKVQRVLHGSVKFNLLSTPDQKFTRLNMVA